MFILFQIEWSVTAQAFALPLATRTGLATWVWSPGPRIIPFRSFVKPGWLSSSELRIKLITNPWSAKCSNCYWFEVWDWIFKIWLILHVKRSIFGLILSFSKAPWNTFLSKHHSVVRLNFGNSLTPQSSLWGVNNAPIPYSFDEKV